MKLHLLLVSYLERHLLEHSVSIPRTRTLKLLEGRWAAGKSRGHNLPWAGITSGKLPACIHWLFGLSFPRNAAVWFFLVWHMKDKTSRDPHRLRCRDICISCCSHTWAFTKTQTGAWNVQGTLRAHSRDSMNVGRKYRYPWHPLFFFLRTHTSCN